MRSRCCLCACVFVCVSLYPHIVAKQRLGKSTRIVARQRLGKNPPIVARQRLGRNVTAVTNTQNNRRTVGRLVLPRTSRCFIWVSRGRDFSLYYLPSSVSCQLFPIFLMSSGTRGQLGIPVPSILPTQPNHWITPLLTLLTNFGLQFRL
jgi:hypothetical protein